ncbi:hypothetical protein J2T57_001712 [Natronocella acetinitrilica]|uniref:Uncharacterized protein n=1 Tax=Natronocella acetinitrilica TaxID=414046 RepID=A0AAE3G2L2_9GAMM|nr:hypothetical protein [Natronocella acetinitrilica]MCP1674610.1 hypothetical protein [Natronocella acetinitrilica]
MIQPQAMGERRVRVQEAWWPEIQAVLLECFSRRDLIDALLAAEACRNPDDPVERFELECEADEVLVGEVLRAIRETDTAIAAPRPGGGEHWSCYIDSDGAHRVELARLHWVRLAGALQRIDQTLCQSDPARTEANWREQRCRIEQGLAADARQGVVYRLTDPQAAIAIGEGGIRISPPPPAWQASALSEPIAVIGEALATLRQPASAHAAPGI